MRWKIGIASLAGFISHASCQDDSQSTSIVDPLTGFTFASYTSDAGVTYRTAVPGTVPADPAPYDAVLQIIAPKTVGWTGMAWGGAMTYDPLSLVWANGQDVTLSSRMAYGYFVPDPYVGATYTTLPGGTTVNDTHYTLTALCTGCTNWGDADTGVTRLDPAAQALLAYAYAATGVEQPANNASTFSIHDNVGHWVHDLKQGTNPDFDAIVTKNSAGNATVVAGRALRRNVWRGPRL